MEMKYTRSGNTEGEDIHIYGGNIHMEKANRQLLTKTGRWMSEKGDTEGDTEGLTKRHTRRDAKRNRGTHKGTLGWTHGGIH